MGDEMQEKLAELEEKMSAIVIIMSLMANKNSNELVESLRKLETENRELQNLIETANSRLDAAEADLENAKCLKEQMISKYKQLCCLEEKLEKKGVEKTVQPEKEDVPKLGPKRGSQSTTQSSKIIALLTQEEFDSVPKYMKARFTLDDVNAAIIDMNAILIEKYAIIGKDKKQLTSAEHKKLLKYKENAWQTEDINKKFKFCTYDDLKDTPSFRMEAKGLNLLMILRHCGKIKEDRKPKCPIRYVAKC